jgi:release factor glutamine methyltransferase
MGTFEYKNIKLEVPENVYYPREDSLLMARVLEKAGVERKLVLEIGSGSGFLSVLMALREAKVTAVDVNEEAVETTRSNAEKNNVHVSAGQSDLFENVHSLYDLIIFNPPYLPVEEGETDAIYAGGLSGREVIERFVAEVRNYLRPKGKVLIVISSLTGEKEVSELFNREGFSTTVLEREKIPWEELIVIEAGL